MILKLDGAVRVGDPLDRIGQAVREIVHRVDAPRVARPVMRRMEDTVHDGITHIDVRTGHVNLRPECVDAVGELAGAHPSEQLEVLIDRAIPVRTLPTRLGQRPAILAHLVLREIADICLRNNFV